MTTDQKIAHVRWYIRNRDKSRNPEMRQYYKDQGLGAAGAWMADMTISMATYNILKEELNKEITQ